MNLNDDTSKHLYRAFYVVGYGLKNTHNVL